MKRYRILNIDFDSTASILGQEIQESWEPEVQATHHQNKARIKTWLIAQFGSYAIERKIQNLVDLGNAPFSILAFHNEFLRQCRSSFIIGSYYPALTGACALGERILNHLILKLRDYYRTTPEYKKVYSKSSFDNWIIAIEVLDAWGILLPDVVIDYKEMARIRNRSIHFDPVTDHNDRDMALEAIKTLSKIIQGQFSGLGLQPWFIPNTPGVSFIKKEYETNPFIKVVYLPACAYVGPNHRIEFITDEVPIKVQIIDNENYNDIEIDDAEFVNLYNNRTYQKRE